MTQHEVRFLAAVWRITVIKSGWRKREYDDLVVSSGGGESLV
jgi:hypothetical protein